MAEASIVFRDDRMNGTGKIYIDTLEAAAELAARYRNASHMVDVINKYDEVALRYEDGAPDWQRGQVQRFKLEVEPYKFDRPTDPYWDADNRLRLLAEAIPFAFDTATGQADDYDFEQLLLQTEHFGGDDVFALIEDASQTAATATKTHSAQEWAETIVRWMSDPSRLFVKYAVEQMALMVKLSEFDLHSSTSHLSAKLAQLEAMRTMK